MANLPDNRVVMAEELDQAVRAIQRPGESYAAAVARFAETPAGQRLYQRQAAGDAPGWVVAGEPHGPSCRDFLLIHQHDAAAIARRDGCTEAAAWTRLMERRPELYREWLSCQERDRLPQPYREAERQRVLASLTSGPKPAAAHQPTHGPAQPLPRQHQPRRRAFSEAEQHYLSEYSGHLVRLGLARPDLSADQLHAATRRALGAWPGIGEGRR